MSLDKRNPENWPYVLYRTDVQEICGIGMNKALDMFHDPKFSKIKFGKRDAIIKPKFLDYLSEL